MKLAVLHYHLGLGGVTRVVRNHLDALSAAVSGDAGEPLESVTLLFSGESPDWEYGHYPFAVRERVIDGLAYREDGSDPRTLAEQVRAAIEPGTVLHTHNHSLGKNAAVPQAISHLAGDGLPVLLQIHDFAEDFRPDGFSRILHTLGPSYGSTLYPQRTNTHYAVLNGRDASVLEAAGVADGRLHRLPNPVADPVPLDELAALRPSARLKLASQFAVPEGFEFWVYPVRGIRRKNLGEMVLLAAALHATDRPVRVGVTLTPENPRELAYFEAWREFAEARQLPVLFGTGDPGRLTFAENLAASDRLVTTSVAEGFGMVFLEAWLVDRLLVGRRIPAITGDFESDGLRLDWLYDSLPIPIDWVGRDDYLAKLAAEFGRLRDGYGLAAGPQGSEATLSVVDELECVDFARLDELLQKRVIDRVLYDDAAAARILSFFDGPADPTGIVAANAQIVRERYGLAETGARLMEIYRSVLAAGSRPADPIDSGVILDRLVSLDQFRLIRT